jgi:hypothetical protein
VGGSATGGLPANKWHNTAYLDEAIGAVTVQIGDEEAVLLRELELLHTGLQELERGSFGSVGLVPDPTGS